MNKEYKRGDLVLIKEEPWNQFAGQYVIIDSAPEKCNRTKVYSFTIPERRGTVPEHLIDRLVSVGHQKVLA